MSKLLSKWIVMAMALVVYLAATSEPAQACPFCAAQGSTFTAEMKQADMILFGTEHVGIVKSVNADGTLTTVEGNTSDGVHERVHQRGDATGFVRL